MTRLLSVAITCISFSSMSAPEAFAWGEKGHSVVAIIAQDHLNPTAFIAVTALLKSEGKSSMSSVASWADKIRGLAIPEQPSHLVRIPLDYSPYDPALSCPEDNCVIGALSSDVKTLRNRKSPIEAKAVALNYLIHFVGDLHQPLHASQNAGFKGMQFGTSPVSLHRVWDTNIIDAQGKSAAALAKDIEQHPGHVYTGGGPVDWAIEGRDIARDDIFPELDQFRINGVVHLPETYAKEKWPIVRVRLEQAGLRLALLLNSIYADPDQMAPSPSQ